MAHLLSSAHNPLIAFPNIHLENRCHFKEISSLNESADSLI